MKKILARLLALAMLFALAACGDKGEDKPADNSPAVENTDNAAKPNAPTTYTYEEDRGDFKVTWELTMYPNGVYYLNETHGLSGNVTEHSGSTWRENDNGTVSTGPWNNADVDKSEFFQPTGECTWILNADGTMEPTDFVAAPVGAGSSFSYSENRGDFSVDWTLILNEDGTYTLEEVHGLSGNLTTHTGKEWTDNGDGTLTTGAWDVDENKSEFFKPNGECTWILNDDGTMTPADAGEAAETTGVKAGKYTYIEAKGPGNFQWDVLLMGNGNCRIDETNPSGEVTEHVAAGWVDNGDGTVTTGEWENKEVNKSDFFKPTGEATWKINEDGTCEPVTGDAPAATTEVNPGKYTYIEAKGPGNFQWDILIMGNGNCRIDETNPSGEVTEHVAEGWTDNGDGTVTTGEWENKEVNKSDFFKPTGEATWKINEDGTCEPVTGDAPAATTEVNPGKYTYIEAKGPGNFQWDVLIMGNGNCRIDETNPSGEVTEHVAAGWVDNGDGTVTTGEWENSDVNKSDFFKPNGEATWKINADGTCEPVVEEKEEPAEGASSVNPGKYAYIETKGPGEFKWEVLLMGNGNCRVDETMPSGEVVQHVANGWTDNGDGTATTGAWEDASVSKSDFFAADGTCTWKINADGTCEPVA